MNKRKLRRKPILLVSPYLFTLSVLFLLMMLGVGFFLYGMIFNEIRCLNLYSFLNDGWLLPVGLLVGTYIVLIIVYVLKSYEFFGTVIVCETGLKLRAPFRRTIHIEYKKIVDIGIDYTWLSVSKQFWIYISTIAISPQYVHRITRLPFSKSTIRIQYSPSSYNVLLHSMPATFNKRIQRLASTIRLHKLGD